MVKAHAIRLQTKDRQAGNITITGNQSTEITQGNQSNLVDMGNQTNEIKMGNQTTTLNGNQTTTFNMGNQSTTLTWEIYHAVQFRVDHHAGDAIDYPTGGAELDRD